MTINVSGDAITNCPVVSTAWVNFDGTGTVAIRDDYNVDSITDNGTGSYTVNFTNVLSDANYAAVGSCGSSGETLFLDLGAYSLFSTSAVDARPKNPSGVATDADVVTVSIFGGES